MSRLWSNAPSLDRYPDKGTVPHVFGSPTSRAGAAKIKPRAESLEDFVLSVLRVAGDAGKTDFEIQDAAAKEGITSLLRPRRATLLARGDIRDSGMKRAAPSGVAATVWVVAP